MSDTPDLDARAREMGWRPQEEFKGDPEKWVDAAEFVRRGEEVLPLVKAENRRLHQKIDQLATQAQQLQAAIIEQRQSMDDLAKFNLQQLQEKLNAQKRELTAELRKAERDEDEGRIAQVEGLLEQNEAQREKLKEPPKAPPTQAEAPKEAPEFRAWAEKNQWYGGSSTEDIAKTGAANAFAARVAREGKTGQAFFDAVDKLMEEAYPKPRRKDPTEEGRPSGGGSGSTSSSDKGFNALPADAKAYARSQEAKFVGPNKMFKTAAEWHSYYAKQYNTEAA